MKGGARFNFYVYGQPSIRCLYFIYECEIYVLAHVKIMRQLKSTLSDNHNSNKVVLNCRPMPDRYVERYGPLPDGSSRHPVSKPLSRPVKRRTSIDDEGHKKKGWFKKMKISKE